MKIDQETLKVDEAKQVSIQLKKLEEQQDRDNRFTFYPGPENKGTSASPKNKIVV